MLNISVLYYLISDIRMFKTIGYVNIYLFIALEMRRAHANINHIFQMQCNEVRRWKLWKIQNNLT